MEQGQDLAIVDVYAVRRQDFRLENIGFLAQGMTGMPCWSPSFPPPGRFPPEWVCRGYVELDRQLGVLPCRISGVLVGECARPMVRLEVVFQRTMNSRAASDSSWIERQG
jgi:hypothetical protein